MIPCLISDPLSYPVIYFNDFLQASFKVSTYGIIDNRDQSFLAANVFDGPYNTSYCIDVLRWLGTAMLL